MRPGSIINNSKFYANNNEARFNHTFSIIMDDVYDSMFESVVEGSFKAICLSGFETEDNSGGSLDQIDGQLTGGETRSGENNYISIIVRPLTPFGDILPNPTNMNDVAEIRQIIELHGSVFRARSDYENDGIPIQYGEIVNCYFESGDASISDFSGLRFSKPVGTDLSSMVGLMGAGGLASLSGLAWNNASGNGYNPKDPNAPKEDESFSSGQCPAALTGPFASLPRKKTEFFKYTKDQVIKSIKSTNYPIQIQRTMYTYLMIEQPNLSFPNNNPSGIQTDVGKSKEIPITSFDYHTCRRDRETYRAFAGFNSLDRGMLAFASMVKVKYDGTFRQLAGAIEQQAETLVWNYYRSWNLAAKPEEIDSIKTNGYFIRNGKKFERKWDTLVTYFTKQLKDFDTYTNKTP